MNEAQLRSLLAKVDSLRNDAELLRIRAQHLEGTATDIEATIAQAAKELGTDPYEVKEF